MKIDRSDPDVLRVHHFPLFIASVCACFWFMSLLAIYDSASGRGNGKQWMTAVPVLLLTLIFVSFAFKVITLTFDGRRKELTWSRRGLFERAGGVVPFGAILGTQIQTSSHSNRTSYRAAVITADAEIPLTAAYGGGAEKACREVCDQIDDFLTLPPLPAKEDESMAKRLAARRAERTFAGKPRDP